MKRPLIAALFVLLSLPAVSEPRGAEKTFDYGARGSAKIDYAGGYVEATAPGTADPAKAADTVEAEAAARRAARQGAYALLAETSGKVQIDAQTRLEDAAASVGGLKLDTDALVEGASVVGDLLEWVDDSASGGKVPRATVTLRLPLGGAQGLAAVVERHLTGRVPPAGTRPPGGGLSGGPAAPLPPSPPSLPAPPAPPAAPGTPEGYDALILDATRLDPPYEATLRPQVVDEKGLVIYGAETSRTGSAPYLRYAPTLELARAAVSPGGRPLVVRAVAAPARGQLLVSGADARAIAEAERTGRFLAEARVAVVVP